VQQRFVIDTETHRARRVGRRARAVSSTKAALASADLPSIGGLRGTKSKPNGAAMAAAFENVGSHGHIGLSSSAPVESGAATKAGLCHPTRNYASMTNGATTSTRPIKESQSRLSTK
jgi:hypothetical protein